MTARRRRRRAAAAGRRLLGGLLVAALVAGLATVLATVLASCTADPPAPAVQRFLEEAPDRSFDRGAVSREEITFSWRLDHRDGLTAWDHLHVETELGDDGTVRLTAATDDPYLWRDAGFQASEVDTLRLVMEGFPSSEAKVFWAGPGEGFSEERQLTLVRPSVDAEGHQVFEFFVAGHPRWSGEVERLRIDPLSVAGSEFVLHRLEGLRHLPDEAALARATGEPWAVEVDHERRSALLAPPGAVHRRDVTVPPASRLRLGAASFDLGRGGDDAAFRLRVAFHPEAGGEEVVWQERVRPGRGWHDLAVDLAGLAGRRGALSLEALQPTPGSVPVLADPRVASTVRAEPSPPNVVLVSVDTLRADRLSLYGYGRPTSPHLDRWAAEHGVAFQRTVAPAAWTLSSHVSMFTGFDAVRHGVNYLASRTPDELTTLAEELRRAGYATAAYTGGVFLSPPFGLHQGFDRFRHWPDPGRNEDELSRHLEAALEYVRDPPSEPYFLFLHTYEVHDPYLPRAPYFAELGGDAGRLRGDSVRVDRGPLDAATGFVVQRSPVWKDEESGAQEPVRGSEIDLLDPLYDSGVRYADELLAPLLAAATGDGAVVAFTSDHGESLGELGLFAHGNLSDEALYVPLVIAAPGRLEGGRRIDRQVRLVDLPPTLLELVGLPVPEGLDGRSLLPLVAGAGEPGRDAWSMAPTSNLGFSLRRPGHRPVAWNDTPWSPTGQRWSDPATGTALDPTAGERHRFRRRLAADLPGLWIRVRNGGDATWGFRLVDVDGVRERLGALDAECLRDSWVDGSPRFLVPAGCEVLMVLEGPPDPQLHLELTDGEGTVVARHTLEVGADLDDRLGVQRAGGAWPVVRRVPDDGLAFSRRAWPPTAGRAPLAAEERRDLKALGYLD